MRTRLIIIAMLIFLFGFALVNLPSLNSREQIFESNLQDALSGFLNKYDSSQTKIDAPSLRDKKSIEPWLHQYLIEHKFLNANDTAANSLKQALMKFQQLNALEADGLLGPKTYGALLIPGKLRYQKIIINQQRWKADPINDSVYIFINIPSCMLYAVYHQQIVLQFKVIVGQKNWKTPVLKSKIEALIVNPYWHVPRSIAVKEMLPDIRRNPNYISENNFKVLNAKNQIVNYHEINWNTMNAGQFQYSFRQEPGLGNALGIVKFVFPSPYSIYLHDTPAKVLFEQSTRTLSHGCIRLEKPMDLIEFLNKNLYLTLPKDSVLQWSAWAKNLLVKFVKPIPLYIGYYTCQADRNGEIYFYEDVYQKDEALRKMLFDN